MLLSAPRSQRQGHGVHGLARVPLGVQHHGRVLRPRRHHSPLRDPRAQGHEHRSKLLGK